MAHLLRDAACLRRAEPRALVATDQAFESRPALERHEGETPGPHLVIRGSRDRLSPILMTTLATGLALVPLVVFGDIAGHEIEHPTAVVIVGGAIGLGVGLSQSNDVPQTTAGGTEARWQ